MKEIMTNYKAMLVICKMKRATKDSYRFDSKKEKRRKPIEHSRTVYIRGATIIDALNVVKKIRYARLISLAPITQSEYIAGVSNAKAGKFNFET